MDLLPKLRTLADLWVAANVETDSTVSLKTLGVRAVSNSKLFDRPAMTVPTFEAVVRWLADRRNWPAAIIPDDALRVLQTLGVGDRLETFEAIAA